MSTCIWSGDLPRALEAGEGPWGSGAIFLLDAGVRSEAQETGGPHSRAKPKQNPATGAKMSNKNVMLHVFSPNIAVAHVFGNKTRPSGPSRLLFFCHGKSRRSLRAGKKARSALGCCKTPGAFLKRSPMVLLLSITSQPH